MIGTTVGTYRVSAKLGEGGMGEVWRATDEKLGREVALKVLPAAVADDEERLSRFQREAKVLASLNHPAIATLFGLETLDGRQVLVMELVEGEDLSARIARGPLPLAEALPIALQIAQALEAAHEKGIVHRDLKPANVKLRPDGAVKVLDFGLAKAWDEERSQSNLSYSPTITQHHTKAGVILGTASYMAPEQAAGLATDRRADVWSFGVVFWEMLTGRKLFEGETVSHVLASVLKDSPDLAALPADLPPVLAQLVSSCLKKKPATPAPVDRGRSRDARGLPGPAGVLRDGGPGRDGGARGPQRASASGAALGGRGSRAGPRARRNPPRPQERLRPAREGLDPGARGYELQPLPREPGPRGRLSRRPAPRVLGGRRGRQGPPLRPQPRRRNGPRALRDGGRRLPVLVAGLALARLLREDRSRPPKDRRDGRSARHALPRDERKGRKLERGRGHRLLARQRGPPPARPGGRRHAAADHEGRRGEAQLAPAPPVPARRSDDSSTSRGGSPPTGARSSSARSTTARAASCCAGRARRSTPRGSSSS